MSAGFIGEKLIYIPLMIYAVMSAARDIRLRQIDLRVSAVFALIGFGLCMLEGRSMASFAKAMLPGAIILIMSLLTGGAIGAGDAIFAATCACYLDGTKLCLCIAIAWVMCAFTALLMIAGDMLTAHRRAYKSRGLPFAAYMLIPIMLISARSFVY